MNAHEKYEEDYAKRKYACSSTGVFVVLVTEPRPTGVEAYRPLEADPDVLNWVRCLGVGEDLAAAYGLLREWWQGERGVRGHLPPAEMYRVCLMDISPDDGRGL